MNLMSIGDLFCTHLFHKYLLSTYYGPASNVGAEKIVRNKIGPLTCSLPYPLASELLPQMDRFSRLTSIRVALAGCLSQPEQLS